MTPNASSTTDATASPCRLCGGPCTWMFQVKVLGKHEVGYFRCINCGSLQTELPHWLNEAYGDGGLARLDTGAAQRNLNNFAASLAVAKVLSARNILDHGGGDGLLCRMLRDYELNCYVTDRYSAPSYALAYTAPNFTQPQLTLMFEVMEHFVNPTEELEKVLASGSGAVLATTEIYENQDSTWWYLVPQTGQHIFFYSRRALEWIAARYNYNLLIHGGYILFYRAKTLKFLQESLLKRALSARTLRAIRCVSCFARPTGVQRDFNNLSNS